MRQGIPAWLSTIVLDLTMFAALVLLAVAATSFREAFDASGGLVATGAPRAEDLWQSQIMSSSTTDFDTHEMAVWAGVLAEAVKADAIVAADAASSTASWTREAPVSLPQAVVTGTMRGVASKLQMDGVGAVNVVRAWTSSASSFVLEAQACFYKHGGLKEACAAVTVHTDASGEDPEAWTVTLLAARSTGWISESDVALPVNWQPDTSSRDAAPWTS